MSLAHSISVFPDGATVARELAVRLVDALDRKPDLVLGLPTGRTPLLLYEQLVRLAGEGRIDFSHVTTFNLDEFLGVAATHPGSYRSFMQRHLFDHVNIDAARINFLNGHASDPVEECCRYEQAIEDAGGIDLLILGIGTNGHIGFNEPSNGLTARTHRVTLKPETRRSNAALFGGDPDAVPAEALSMGIGTILDAKAAILVATGEKKAACVEQLVTGPITTQLPASFLQLHRDVEILLDSSAAARLER
jgi:glucosamine-6-phosphate deaminase